MCDPLTARYLRNTVTISFFGTPQYSTLLEGLELALNGNTSFFPPGPSITEFLGIPLVCLDEGMILMLSKCFHVADLFHAVIDNDTFAGVDQFRIGTAQVSAFEDSCFLSITFSIG